MAKHYLICHVNIRIRGTRFAFISENVSVFDLKCGKKCYPNLIPCEPNPFPSLLIY